jgi:hypothetical protein
MKICMYIDQYILFEARRVGKPQEGFIRFIP